MLAGRLYYSDYDTAHPYYDNFCLHRPRSSLEFEQTHIIALTALWA